MAQPPLSPPPNSGVPVLPYHAVKSKLNDKAAGSVAELAALCKLVLKGSGSQELLLTTAKGFASQDRTIETSSNTLQKTFLLSSQLCSLSSEMEKQLNYLDRFMQANNIAIDRSSSNKIEMSLTGQYGSAFEMVLYQLEMAVDNRAEPGQISAISDRILHLVRTPTGSFNLQPDITPVVEFQILLSIIDRCAKRGGGEVLAPQGPYFLTSVFEHHLKAGFYSSICQLASLATGIGSPPVLHRLAHILEACPSTVLHAVFCSLTTDYQILCPKSFQSVRNLSKLSLPFASVLAQGALLPGRQMRLQTFSPDQFSLPWLEVIVEWLSDFPAILACSPTGSSSFIVSVSNFIVLITTASAVIQTNITNTTNANFLQNTDRTTLKQLQSIAEKLNSGLLLAAFSCPCQVSTGLKPPMPKINSSELTGSSFALLNEAAHMIGVPTLISTLLDAPIVRLLQHIQALRSVGIMHAVSHDDLVLLRSKFAPQSGAKLIDIINETVKVS